MGAGEDRRREVGLEQRLKRSSECELNAFSLILEMHRTPLRRRVDHPRLATTNVGSTHSERFEPGHEPLRYVLQRVVAPGTVGEGVPARSRGGESVRPGVAGPLDGG
jgi:hypothetical protein